MSCPRSSKHNDVYEIDKVLQKILKLLELAAMNTHAIFINADAVFNSEELNKRLHAKQIHPNV